ncbi:putative RNA recognition motif domain, nucleotide-binding alpha-beta plait domain superfamily [Helianthus debilis subsp. tardiflorus]
MLMWRWLMLHHQRKRINFFKDAAEVVEVRFAIRDDRFAGYVHVEFVTREAAQEALEVNGEPLLDHPVKLD